MENSIYLIGLLVAGAYVFFGIDDVVWDILGIWKGFRRKKRDRLPISTLDKTPPRLLAIMIAAWHEAGVIEDVVDNMIRSLHYPTSMYHVFIGTYPNDESTITAVRNLEGKYPNVHMVQNPSLGPTCKADNINAILTGIRTFEVEKGWRFLSCTVHDAEDVVHPYELKATNYLMDHHECVQFPVFPLMRKPRLGNWLSTMTSASYADEFAENHYRTMDMRNTMDALVPSAGTGFVLSRRLIDSYEGQDVFPEDSLTEDYKLSVSLAEKGHKVYYSLEKVPRLLANGKNKWEYIATRSIFPSDFRSAVRQKSRWIYGITMQSARLRDIPGMKSLSFTGRYSLYKDLKAKLGNLMILPGYGVFLYFIASLFVRLPVMYPFWSFSWWLCLILTVLMVVRQTTRAYSIVRIYGYRSMFYGCLMPPLMPVRLVWGNIINLVATLKAWKTKLVGPAKKKGQPRAKVPWSKTEHEFLNEGALQSFRRNIGDVLLEKDYILEEVLRDNLKEAQKVHQRLGTILLGHDLVTEDQVAEALAGQHLMIYLPDLSKFRVENLLGIGVEEWKREGCCPVLVRDHEVVLAQSIDAGENLAGRLRLAGYGIHGVYASSKEIEKALKATGNRNLQAVEARYLIGGIDWEQAVLGQKYGGTEGILAYMGLA